MLNEMDAAYLREGLPFFKELCPARQRELEEAVFPRRYQAGEAIPGGDRECAGLLLVKSGQIRVYLESEAGKEITLYRLFERDICVFSASCMMKDIRFTLFPEAEKDTDILLIPAAVYSRISKEVPAAADFIARLTASRFSDVMWVMEQILFMSFDRRLALFLLEQASIEGGSTLRLTHEVIARHMGSAREVVSRMLKYFQEEGFVSLQRGGLTLLDTKGLSRLAEG